jgi:hypothetical protein
MTRPEARLRVDHDRTWSQLNGARGCDGASGLPHDRAHLRPPLQSPASRRTRTRRDAVTSDTVALSAKSPAWLPSSVSGAFLRRWPHARRLELCQPSKQHITFDVEELVRLWIEQVHEQLTEPACGVAGHGLNGGSHIRLQNLESLFGDGLGPDSERPFRRSGDLSAVLRCRRRDEAWCEIWPPRLVSALLFWLYRGAASWSSASRVCTRPAEMRLPLRS